MADRQMQMTAALISRAEQLIGKTSRTEAEVQQCVDALSASLQGDDNSLEPLAKGRPPRARQVLIALLLLGQLVNLLSTNGQVKYSAKQMLWNVKATRLKKLGIDAE